MARIELDADERRGQWEDIKFEDVYARLFTAKVVSSQTELATLLKIGRAAVSYIAKKGSIPREWKVRFERAGLGWNWVAYGDGSKYNSNHLIASGAIVSVKNIVGINDGYIERSTDVFEYPLHKTSLAQFNINTRNLGYVVQSGSAMQPFASDGDIWVVDMDRQTFDIGCTYVVKIGENAAIGARIVVDLDGVSNTVKFRHGNPELGMSNVNMSDVEICGRCEAKVCRVL